MKTLFSGIILSLALSLGFVSTASAASIDYYPTTILFDQSAQMIGGGGEIDTFTFTNNNVSGTYHFYSTGAVDLFGVLNSNTYGTVLAQNDDGGSSWNFCVESYIYAGESLTLEVFGYSSSSDGPYSVHGYAGSCSDSYYSYNFDAIPASSAGADETSAISLPVVLFSLLGLAAVRLRRFFA
ncbi:MAG: hypothetical protein OEY36_11445 [Gammaproteobacteria bacterium]|nr:hypothetical protein [Gammaproteobacteria bacterium]